MAAEDLNSILPVLGLFSWPIWIAIFWLFMPDIYAWMEKKSF